MNRIEQKVLSFIDEKKLIEKGDKILVGLSGGPDSVFLLHLLVKFRKRFKIDVGAVHINHLIRGKAADDDEEFCKKLSLNLNVELISVRCSVKPFAKKHKLSIEEAGRIIRYNEFEKALKKISFSKIATAHNSTDNAETVLLNLIKGTGLKGISGIPAMRSNIIRPILNISKEEILEYLNKYGIKFRIDESNLSGDFERNYLRQNIVPLIKKKLNPNFENTIFQSSEIYRNLSSYIDKNISKKLKEAFVFENGGLKILISKIQNVDDKIKNYLLKSAIEEKFPVQLSFTDLKNIILLISKETGKRIILSKNLIAARERDFVIIFQEDNSSNFDKAVIKEGTSIKVNDKKLFINLKKRKPANFSGNRLDEFISADSLTSRFELRRWRNGDRFIPLGLKGSKKISDFLNEQKIASSKKKEQLVLTNRNRIVWVLGLRLDDRFKIKKETKKVIELCLK